MRKKEICMSCEHLMPFPQNEMNWFYKIFLLVITNQISHSFQYKFTTQNYLQDNVLDYYNSRNIRSVYLFCCTTEESRLFAKSLEQLQSDNSKNKISQYKAFVANQENGHYRLNFAPNKYSRLGIFVNINCHNNWRFFKETPENFKNENYHWLFWSDSYNKRIELVKSFQIIWNNHVSLATRDLTLYKFRSIDSNNEVAIINLRAWHEAHLFQLKTINGISIKAYLPVEATSLNETSLLIKTSPDENLIKFSFSIHNLLRNMYNFSWDLYTTDLSNSSTIYSTKNGSICYSDEGQFRALELMETDIGLYPAEQLSCGLNIVDILPPIKKFRQCFVFIHPRRFSAPLALLDPFSTVVWLLFALTLLICSIGNRIASYTDIEDVDNNEQSFGVNILLAVGVVTQQGLVAPSNRLSKRLVQISLLMLCVITYGFYSAALVILLLSPTPKKIDKIDALMESGLTLGAEDTHYNRFLFTSNYSQEGNIIYTKRIKGNGYTNDKFYSLEKGLEKVRTSGFALFGYDANIYSEIYEKYNDRDKCALAEVLLHKPLKISTFLRKNFPYKEQFKRGIILLMETGILSAEDRYWNSQRPPCLQKVEFNPVDVKSTRLAYMVYFYGTLIAFMILFLELVSVENNSGFNMK